MYQARTYRNKMGLERFISFNVSNYESDLWVGIDKQSYTHEIKDFVLKRILYYRELINHYSKNHKEFLESHKPVVIFENSPKIVKEMAKAAKKSNIGPMGSVAGAFSEFIAKDIIEKYNVKEIVIENGGDIFLKIETSIIISVFAGKSSLSEKIGIQIPPSSTPCGVCTSAGTIGHSFSYGKADALMIVCKNTLLADVYATKFCNKVIDENSIQPVLEEIKTIPEILSAIIIINDKVGFCGSLEVKFL